MILGAALSGAGPSVLMFVNPKKSVQSARKLAAAEIAKKGLNAELFQTAISLRGGRF